MKLCKDCKWREPRGIDICNNPHTEAVELERFKGIVIIKRPSCMVGRMVDYPCGPDGRFWQPKPRPWWAFWRPTVSQ